MKKIHLSNEIPNAVLHFTSSSSPNLASLIGCDIYGRFFGNYRRLDGKDRIFIGDKDGVKDLDLEDDLYNLGYQF